MVESGFCRLTRSRDVTFMAGAIKNHLPEITEDLFTTTASMALVSCGKQLLCTL